jgi:predicted metal-dependent hydrolase
MAKRTDTVWRINDIDIPVRIVQEWRKNNRISINKDKVILRMPLIGGAILKESYKSWAMEWIAQQFIDYPEIKQRFVVTEYHSADQILLPNKTYELEIVVEDRKTSSAKLQQSGVILIKMSDQIEAEHLKSKTINTLLSRVIGQDQQPRVADRIHAINQEHFQESIKQIRLKNNSSNWGSCSSSGNINISTRTLFAPLEVQDYVFVHELAHLKELNHSPKYWSIVKSVMPDYKRHEKWLKVNGHQCSF